ncbi:MAG: molecular chaperone HtpG, partial [Methyloversatilis sp. 12-65-5]
KQARERDEGEFKPLVERLKATLAEQVKEVRITHRLTDSPACLIADEHDIGGNLARILKSAGRDAPASKPTLEINPQHPVVQRLRNEDAHFDDWAAVLFDQALLAEGGALEDPATFVRRMNQLMLAMSGGRPTA